jgi:lipoprotein-anchoring transpeptidase ErfK/SrfK
VYTAVQVIGCTQGIMGIDIKAAAALGLVILAAGGGAFALLTAEPPAPARAVVAAAKPPVPAAAPAPDPQFVIKRVLPIEGPIKYGEWHWNEDDVPAGPIVMTVDLEARVISVFRGGYEIGAAAVLLGSPEKPTPTGVFPITQKRRHHVSNLYGSPMPYMQRLTDDGITLHATKVELGYASRGCIGMPEAFARKVFETTTVGDRVFITRGKKIGIGDALVQS